MDEIIITPEAGAETQTVPAETQGDQTTATPEAGTEPDVSQTAEDGGTGETTPTETVETEPEGNQDKGKHQTTLEERAIQLAEKRFAEMQTKFEQTLQSKQAQEKVPFVVVDMAKVNEHFQAQEDLIAEMKLDGNFVEARRIQKELDTLDASIEANNKKRTEWEAQQTEQQKKQVDFDTRLQRIDESAEFYRANKGIPQETWDAAGQWLNTQFQADPVLGRQFSDIIERQGEMAAFKWADEYCQKNMGAGAKADKASKEAAKQNLPANGGTLASVGTVTTWDALMAKPSTEINKFQKENPAVFQKLKDTHFK